MLGVAGVPARTFHSAALAQLHYFAGSVGEVLASKASILLPIARALPVPFRYRPLADLATEIEWAKNRRLTPDTYRRSLDDHEPPVPDDVMERVFRTYEARKSERGLIDFEDLLEHAVRMYDEDPNALAAFQERYQAFTVDEYQDVNLLQQSLLERWVGDRDDLCVVGDDYQSIYSFTGATPEYLLGMPSALPGRAGRAAGGELPLDAGDPVDWRTASSRSSAARRRCCGRCSRAARSRWPWCSPTGRRRRSSSSAQVRRLAGEGVPYEEMAVLYRLNARSEDYEEAFALAGIPFQVRGAAFIRRQAAQRTIRMLRGRRDASAIGAVTEAVRKQGWTARPATRPRRRGADAPGRPLPPAVARRAAPPGSSVADFLRDLEERFSAETQGRGVELLTYHRAKGLEWEAVFLPRLEEKELPYGKATRGDRLAEERRLFYVGMTRAKRSLTITWTAGAKPSRFLAELGVVGAGAREGAEAGADPGVRSATPLASRAREGRRGARVRRLPRLDAPRDRRRPPADARAAERDRRRRPDEAGALRGRPARSARDA